MSDVISPPSDALGDLPVTEPDAEHATAEPEVPAGSPVVLAHVIAEAIRDVAARGCEHAWDIVEVQSAPEPPVRLPMQVNIPQTFVLVRCIQCGIPDVLTLPGAWTLEQLHKSV